MRGCERTEKQTDRQTDIAIAMLRTPPRGKVNIDVTLYRLIQSHITEVLVHLLHNIVAIVIYFIHGSCIGNSQPWIFLYVFIIFNKMHAMTQL